MLNSNTNTTTKKYSTWTQKRIAVFEERMRKTLKNINFTNIDDEIAYLNKLEIMENNINKVIEHKMETFKAELDAKDKEIEEIITDIENITKESNDARLRLIELDKRYSGLHLELLKQYEMRNKIFSEIIKLRKENTKGFDKQLETQQQDDIDIKSLKSELCMLLNMLKLRILNPISDDPNYYGYVMNTTDNTLCFVNIDRNLDNLEKGKIYWNAMNELIVKKYLNSSNLN
jgi:chromosome segregation ATPase